MNFGFVFVFEHVTPAPRAHVPSCSCVGNHFHLCSLLAANRFNDHELFFVHKTDTAKKGLSAVSHRPDHGTVTKGIKGIDHR